MCDKKVIMSLKYYFAALFKQQIIELTAIFWICAVGRLLYIESAKPAEYMQNNKTQNQQK